MKSKLYLIRHGQSTYNLENRFTGWKDVDLTPLGISQAKEAAKLLGLIDSLGTISKGKIADIVAVDGDPLEDITVLEDVDFVMKEGKVYKSP